MNASMPVFTLVFAAAFGDERFSVEKAGGVVLGLVGVAVLFGAGALRSLGAQTWAQLAVVGAAVSYAIAAVFGRHHLKGYTPVAAAAWQLTAAAVVMAPIALLHDLPLAGPPSGESLAAAAGLAVLGTAVAYLMYFYLLRGAGATQTSLVTFLIPLTGILWGAVFLGERIGTRAFIALGLILVGVAGATERVSRVVRH